MNALRVFLVAHEQPLPRNSRSVNLGMPDDTGRLTDTEEQKIVDFLKGISPNGAPPCEFCGTQTWGINSHITIPYFFGKETPASCLSAILYRLHKMPNTEVFSARWLFWSTSASACRLQPWAVENGRSQMADKPEREFQKGGFGKYGSHRGLRCVQNTSTEKNMNLWG